MKSRKLWYLSGPTIINEAFIFFSDQNLKNCKKSMPEKCAYLVGFFFYYENRSNRINWHFFSLLFFLVCVTRIFSQPIFLPLVGSFFFSLSYGLRITFLRSSICISMILSVCPFFEFLSVWTLSVLLNFTYIMSMNFINNFDFLRKYL